MNDRSRTRSIRRRKWSAATNDSKSMVVLTFGSNACTPCIATSLLDNSGVPNAMPSKTQSTAKNQAESELVRSALFQQARWFYEPLRNVRDYDTAARRRK